MAVADHQTIVDIPGIEVDTAAALSDTEAQRLQDQVQQQLAAT